MQDTKQKRPGRRAGRGRLLASSVLAGVAAFSAPVLTAALVLGATPATAQDYTSGLLTGTVEDETGAAVAGARVVVTSGQGLSREVATGADGGFRIPALPVGGYTVKIDKDGYAAVEDRISVAPVGSSYSFLLAADGAAVDEVVVTAQRKSDFNRNDIGATVDVQELTERVPVGRSINAVTLLTPGAAAPDATINASSRRNQSLVSLGGTSAAESAYYINGMQVTDQRNFLGYADLPFDFIQTIETKTGGYQAEFGRGTGGVVNIVTRSGTNEFEAGISAFWTPSSLQSDRGVAYGPGGSGSKGQVIWNQYAESDVKEYSIWAGGPIIEDRLFFFGVVNPRDVQTWGAASFSTPTTNNGQQTFSSYNDPRWGAKFDWLVNEDHRLEATIFSDKTTTDFEPYVFDKVSKKRTGRSPGYFSEAGGTNSILKYTGSFTDWFTLSALIGRAENGYRDYGPAAGSPGIFDYARPGGAGYLNANRFITFNLDGEDKRDTLRVDADLYADFFGEHHIRIGYDREDMESRALVGYNGGARYYLHNEDLGDYLTGTPDGFDTSFAEVLTFTNDGTFTAEQTAYYVQDSWRITPDLTVQAGLRQDLYDYKNINGVSYAKITDQFAPRLGFNWDPFGEGQDRVYGSFGRYYLPIATNTSIRASSGEIFKFEYFALTRDASGAAVVGPDGYPAIGAPVAPTTYLSPPSAPDPRSIVEADLKPMYEREFLLGYEHRFEEGPLADWSVGVRLIDRKLESTIEDTSIGDAVLRYCARNGIAGCDGSDQPYVLINPGDEARVYLNLAGNSAPGTKQYYTLTAEDLNLPEVERSYRAMELTFERPFDGKWGLQGSYTLAKSYGNYEGAVKSDIGQTDTSITQDFDHYYNQAGAEGYLPNHHRHTLKLYGNYALTDRLNIGASYTGQSGRKWSCVGYSPDAGHTSGTPSAWYCPIGPGGSRVPTPRGSMGETPFTHNVDLSLSYKVLEDDKLGDLTARVEVFNLFDFDEVTRVVEQGEVYNGKGTPTDVWGKARSFQAPRTVRLGLQYRF